MNKQFKIPKIFAGFILASAIMWLFINLSKEYSSTLTYQLKYSELAQNRILQEQPISKIDLLVRATGFKLFSTNFSNRSITLLANKLVQKSKENYYLLPNDQRINIQRQLPSGLQLQQILIDSIHLKLGSLISKKVPVIADLDIQYAIGYQTENIKIIPDSIVISGPELQLKSINNLKLENLLLENVSENIEKELKIRSPQDASKVKLAKKTAQVRIQVDKFTEGEFDITVQVKNVSASTQISIFPKSVKVIYKVGLNNFNKVTENSFEVMCDYQYTKKNNLSYLIPKLTEAPKYVSIVRIVPEKIDYLINKK